MEGLIETEDTEPSTITVEASSSSLSSDEKQRSVKKKTIKSKKKDNHNKDDWAFNKSWDNANDSKMKTILY